MFDLSNFWGEVVHCPVADLGYIAQWAMGNVEFSTGWVQNLVSKNWSVRIGWQKKWSVGIGWQKMVCKNWSEKMVCKKWSTKMAGKNRLAKNGQQQWYIAQYTRSCITQTCLYQIITYFKGHLPHQKSLH